VLARAPLLLQESLLFPYREGLKFEVDMLTDKGADGAFAGVLDRPPASSYEIMNPHAYERKVKVPVLTMPDVHPLLDADYAPYDVGVMGQIDVRILSELFGGPQMAAALTPAWDGGMYGDELDKQFSHVSRDTQDESDESERIYQTNEGPVLIATAGNSVFVSESFDLSLARKLQFLMVSAQHGNAGEAVAANRAPRLSGPDLTGPMINFFAGCGMMRAALPIR
jgi:hypothetical protein